MADSDPFRNFKFKMDGLFVRLSADTSPRKLRVLTTDPVVSMDKFGNTRFAFVVWDYNEDKARIFNTTPGVARQLQAVHQDEDFGANLRKVDIKITTTGSELETKHVVTALPKSATLMARQIEEAQDIDLDTKIEDGQRMSFYKPGEPLAGELSSESGYDKAKKKATSIKNEQAEDEDIVIEDIGDEPIDLSSIPF